MPIFKCKSCGGEIRVAEGQSVAVCEYCQREQSLSKSKSEIVINLFNRANSLRLKNEFDKSQEIYEKILNEEPDDAEAHWGIVLCKYGIEYVKESEWAYSKIPTCHRTQYESILADADYLAAVENADVAQKLYYEGEAKKIADLQKSVLEVVRNEKPFDVFICYKEKDEYGNRTVDSGIANDIYHQLTQEGFKVFYAAITLEDKLGTAYEPYIFAALNSAKVMLVLGTKPDYFNAVWVKNEWARYLKLIKNDRNRLLIPCYRDMDAYELPEEFAHLQAQDMTKVGFITDIIRGIKKIIPKEPKTSSSAAALNINTSSTAAPILKRVFLCLEDRDFQKAESLLEQVFNLDPECAEAYIAKMMIERKLTTRDALYSLDFDLKDDPMYVRAIRFADEKYKATLEEYRDESIYRKANSYLEQNTIEKYNAAKPLYKKIIEYKDARAKMESCDIGITEINYQAACRLKKEANNFNDTARATEATEAFRKLGEYKDSPAQVDECIELKKLIQYKNAVDAKQRASGSSDADVVSKHYANAISLFAGLGDYKDSASQKEECESLKVEALYTIALSIKESADKNNDAFMYQKASQIFWQISNYKDSAELYVECQDKEQDANTDATYRKAVDLSQSDDIQSLNTAINMFNGIFSWKDSAERLSECQTKLSQLKEKQKNFERGKLLKSELQKILEQKAHNKTVLASAKKLKAKRTYYRIMRLFVLLGIAFLVFCLYGLYQLSNEGDVSLINGMLSQEQIQIMGVFSVIAITVMIIINSIVTVCFDKPSNLLFVLIPVVNSFLIMFAIAKGIKALFCPLDKAEKMELNKSNSIQKELEEEDKRKKEIESELKELLGIDGFNNYKMSLSSSVTNRQDTSPKKKGVSVAKIVCVCLIVIVVLCFVAYLFVQIIPNQKYNKAIDLINQGEAQQAYTILKEIEDYKDSMLLTTEYEIQLIKNANVGDTVQFGYYEQDSNETIYTWFNGKESIDWVILEKRGDKVMLISQKCLDEEPEIDSLQWADSTVRKWLNETFLKNAFSTAQQNRIIETEISNMRDGNQGITSSNTLDKVYLLSIEEVQKYFVTDESRVAELTEHSLNIIGGYYPEYTGWALRTPSNDDRCIAYVGYDGQICGINDIVICSGKAVRPVIWIDVSE